MWSLHHGLFCRLLLQADSLELGFWSCMLSSPGLTAFTSVAEDAEAFPPGLSLSPLEFLKRGPHPRCPRIQDLPQLPSLTPHNRPDPNGHSLSLYTHGPCGFD